MARPPPAGSRAGDPSARGRSRATSPARLQSTRAVALLVLALAALVAAVSNGTSIWVPPRTGWVDRERLVLVVLELLAVLVAVVGGGAFLLHRALAPRRPETPPLRALLLRAVPLTTVTFALAGLLLIARTPLSREPPSDAEAGQGSGGGTPLQFRGSLGGALDAGEGAGEEGPASDPDAADRTLILIVVFGAVVAIALGGAWWWAHRSRSPTGEDGSPLDRQRAAAHDAVTGTIDAMLADPDPRTAIIGAYARLLEGLAASGTPRRDYEGPVEHLRRVLTVLRVPARPLRRLVELFEAARFSTHALTVTHRTQALEALRAVADELRGPPGPQPSPPRRPTSLGTHA